MAFPYSYKFNYHIENELFIDDKQVEEVINNSLKHYYNESSGEFEFESGVFGLAYSFTIVKTGGGKISMQIKSKSIVFVIFIFLLVGAFVPRIGFEGYLLFALFSSVIVYFLLFSIFSSEISKKISRILVNFEKDHTANCDGENCCPACGHELSETDLFCPNCGLRVKQNRYTKPLNLNKVGKPQIRYHYKKNDEKNRS